MILHTKLHFCLRNFSCNFPYKVTVNDRTIDFWILFQGLACILCPHSDDNHRQAILIHLHVSFLQQTDLEAEQSSAQQGTTTTPNSVGPKRLHVSNIPFRFREADLKSLLGVSLPRPSPTSQRSHKY